MSVEIITPQIPKPLRITSQMWEDFLSDPVLAAWVLFRVKLDAFQAARLRYYWWVQVVMDSSGVGSGKTIVDFLFLNLRCILLPDQHAAIYYPTFGTGKNEFWNYFADYAISGKAPIFTAQLGNPLKLDANDVVDGDGTTHGPDCYKAFYRNGNRLLMPAPSFAKDAVTQASLSLNVLVIEEWPQIDASSDGINKQLIDRCRRASWNQFHPIWGNHIVYSGHAQSRMHPSATRFNQHQREVERGDPNFANISFCYKDYSDLLTNDGRTTFRQMRRNEMAINTKRKSSSKAEWLGQGFGIWGANGTGWFTEESILACVASGRARGLLPVLSRQQYEAAFPE